MRNTRTRSYPEAEKVSVFAERTQNSLARRAHELEFQKEEGKKEHAMNRNKRDHVVVG